MTARAAAIRFICTFASLAACLLLGGCNRYADFTLPKVHGTPTALQFHSRAEPVLLRGTWDSSDVLNPSVVEHSGQFFNFYSGFDGQTWRTGLAISPDGVRWTKQLKPVLSPDAKTWESSYIAANGSALWFEGEFRYWYQTGAHDAPRIAYAHSKDGVSWTKHPTPVLDYGPRGSFDESATADPCVIRIGDTFYLYYLGQNRARQQRLGVARSRGGIVWEKFRGSPFWNLPAPGSGAFNENGDGEPAVFVYRDLYWMLWTGRDSKEHRSLGLAHSNDGVHWTPTKQVFRGDRPWNATIVADPTVLIIGGKPTVWFGGGNQPSPDERLNGQIGIGYIE